MVGGVAIDDASKDVELPKPLVGEAFRFKGDRAVCWGRVGNSGLAVEQTENFWVLLPAAAKPSRLIVVDRDDEVRVVVETRDSNGRFLGMRVISEIEAKRARARFMLYYDMYRRGYLYMGWREHQARKVDGILHPFPDGTQNGICPRQKADAEQFCREVRSVLWQYGDMGPVASRTNCVTGYEDGWYGDGEVRVVDREDPPIADPAARAEAVVRELHIRAMCARKAQADWQPGGLFVLGPYGEVDTLYYITFKPVFFDVEQGDYPNLGPKAIATDIIAREGCAVQMMFKNVKASDEAIWFGKSTQQQEQK